MTASRRRKREINWFPFTARTRQQLATLLRFRHAGLGFLPRLLRVWLLVLLCASACQPAPAQSKPETRVTLDVRLTADARGNLGYLVFNSPSGFPGETSNAIRHGFVPIPTGARQMNVDVTLPPGTYAVSVYEDLNGNGKLDHNLLGIPREPVGASNNPRARMGPPRFSDCSFRVSDKSELITIFLVGGL